MTTDHNYHVSCRGNKPCGIASGSHLLARVGGPTARLVCPRFSFHQLQDQIRLLERERTRLEERKSEGIRLFRRWKQHLLVDTDHEQTADDFLAHCILPRCLLTPEDAMYCAAFIRRMTLEDTPFFSFMYFVQRVGLCNQLLLPGPSMRCRICVRLFALACCTLDYVKSSYIWANIANADWSWQLCSVSAASTVIAC